MKIQISTTNLFFISVLVFVSILLLNVNTFYWADDYCFMNDINNRGIFKNCIFGYYNWDGRYATPGGFVQSFMLQYIPVNFITLFWNLCFFFSAFVAYYIIALETEISKTTTRSPKLILLLFSILFWFGNFPCIAEIVYWATGGVYSFCLLQGAIWIYFFLKFQKADYNLVSKIGFFLFSITVGATSINFSIGFLVLIGITILQNFYFKNKTKLGFNFVVLVAVLSGFLFIALAPGNFVRMHSLENFSSQKLSFFLIIKNYFLVLFEYIFRASILALVTLIFSLWLMNKRIYELKNIVNFNIKLFKKSKIINCFFELKWFFVACSTALPFITIPIVASARTMSFFSFFMLLFVVIFIVKLITNYNFSNIKKPISNKIVHNNLIYFTIWIVFLFVCYNFSKGIVLKKEITKREEILKNPNSKIAIVKLIDSNLASKCYKFTDFAIDQPDKNWILNGQEYYFKKKIFVEK